jgi:hypothetical protein
VYDIAFATLLQETERYLRVLKLLSTVGAVGAGISALFVVIVDERSDGLESA